MKIIEKIKILKNIIEEKQRTDLKKLDEKQRYIISQQIFVLKELQTNLMHSIGMQTKEEKDKEEKFYGI